MCASFSLSPFLPHPPVGSVHLVWVHPVLWPSLPSLLLLHHWSGCHCHILEVRQGDRGWGDVMWQSCDSSYPCRLHSINKLDLNVSVTVMCLHLTKLSLLYPCEHSPSTVTSAILPLCSTFLTSFVLLRLLVFDHTPSLTWSRLLSYSGLLLVGLLLSVDTFVSPLWASLTHTLPSSASLIGDSSFTDSVDIFLVFLLLFSYSLFIYLFILSLIVWEFFIIFFFFCCFFCFCFCLLFNYSLFICLFIYLLLEFFACMCTEC